MPVTLAQGHRTMRDAHKAYMTARAAWFHTSRHFTVYRGGADYTEGVRNALRAMARRAATCRARYYVTVAALARRYQSS